MPKKEGEGLDKTYHDAHEVAKKTRKRNLSWAEQLEFFQAHAEEFGDYWEFAMQRAEMGFDFYADDSFWYPLPLLRKMFDEEIADSMVYKVILKYRHEVIGMQMCKELSEDDGDGA